MDKKINKFIYWAPRVASILFILFLAMFSLDVFGQGYSFSETVVGLLMHNIPAFILLVVLLISWKHEIVGGIAFILAGLLYTAMIIMNAIQGSFEWYMLSWILTIAGPAFIVGILFIVNWIQKRSHRDNL
jgi:hypothetical protein